MKKIKYKLLALVMPAAILTSCIPDQEDFRYNGPSLAEFKNSYLELQSRIGTANFQSLTYNVVTLENTSLTKLSVRQPAVPLTGVISIAAGTTTLTGQAAVAFTASINGSTLNVTAVAGTPLAAGVAITGPGVAANTVIVRAFSGTGGAGTYVLNNSQTVASVGMTTVSTQFLTELLVGSIVNSATGVFVGAITAITDNNTATIGAPALLPVTRSPYRASFANGVSAPAFQDSILVQLVGRQVSSDITVTYIEDPSNPLAPAGAVEAIEGVHFNFVRNDAGELVINGDSNSGYIYIDVLESLTAADPNRVTLMITLTDAGDIAPSQNYRTFTYNIIK